MRQEGVDQVRQEMVQITALGLVECLRHFLLHLRFSAQSDPGCEYDERWNQKWAHEEDTADVKER